MNVTLEQARQIVDAALAHARAGGFKPMGVGVLDSRGALVAYAAEEGSAIGRSKIALGKAHAALFMGVGSRALLKMSETRAPFVGALSDVAGGEFVPVPGGVLIKSGGEIIGAVGMSGDTSDNDEAAALAGIKAAGLEGDGG